MSDQSTEPNEATPEPPDYRDTVLMLPPPFDGVRVDVHLKKEDEDGDVYWIRYFGSEDDLIASGCCDESMLAKKEKKYERRRDKYGDGYTVNSWFVSHDGNPVRRYKVIFKKSKRNAALLPCAAAAIAAYEKYWLRSDEWDRYRKKRGPDVLDQEQASITVAEWKEKATPYIRVVLQTVLSELTSNSRLRVFRLNLADALRFEELGEQFVAEATALIGAARLEDCKTGKPAGGNILRLVVDNHT